MDFTCYRCGQSGHYSASCPTRDHAAHPAAPPQQAAEPLEKEKKIQVTVECGTCRRDWAAVLHHPDDTLRTITCPWCRMFEITPQGIRRRGVQPSRPLTLI